MAVYVDDYRVLARVGGLHSRWSHLIADTVEELHEFAGRLGLRREWFQDPCVNGRPLAKPGTRPAENWHYDVTDRMRTKAIALGAKPIPLRELPQIIDARWKAKQQVATATDGQLSDVILTHTAYMEHVEGCWYVVDPGIARGRACQAHNDLYDAWQAALQKMKAA